MNSEFYLALWLVIISILSVVLTIYDTAASKSDKWRIPEKILMLTGFLGGATAMYAMMQLIRHKTKHKKFMAGLPVFIILHIALILLYFYRF